MPRVALDLNNAADRQKVNSEWKVGEGFVPGEPKEGRTARLLASPPREADFEDSGWSVCADIRESLSVGFTFAWYRTTVELPLEVNGMPVEGARLWFETNVDNYGEIWVNGQIDRHRRDRGDQCPSAHRAQPWRHPRQQIRYCLPGGQRTVGRASRGNLYALCHSGL